MEKDDLVARGTGIPDAENFYCNLKSRTNINLFFIPKDHVKKVEDMLPDVKYIPQLPETRKMHQIMIEKINEIFYRNVSCFCNTNEQKR